MKTLQQVTREIESLVKEIKTATDNHEKRTAQRLQAQVEQLKFFRLYLETDLGFGLVHSMDMLQAVQKIESEEWMPQSVDKVDLQKRFGFCLSPHQRHLATTANP